MSLCVKLLNFCGMRLRNKAIVHNLPQGANLPPNQQWVVHNVKQAIFSDRASVVDDYNPCHLLHLVKTFEVTVYFSLHNKIYMH